MRSAKILIVDDERSARKSLLRVLEQLTVPGSISIDEAITGREMFDLLRTQTYDLILLSLQLSDRDGIDILRQLREQQHTERVVGLAERVDAARAVQAMKLGAADVIQKPLTPRETTHILKRALERQQHMFRLRLSKGHRAARSGEQLGRTFTPLAAPDQEFPETYGECLQQAKSAIELQKFSEAIRWVKRAVGIDSSRPNGFNVLGVLMEIDNDVLQAQKYYRAAIALDPTFEPAHRNLHRTTVSAGMESRGERNIDLGIDNSADEGR